MELLLKGEKINLRKLKKSDAEAICKHANDPAMAKYTTLSYPYTLKNAEGFIPYTHQKIKRGEAYELGIELKESGKIIGIIGLLKVNAKNKNAAIGYWLGREYWGQQIMTEAVPMILKFGFRELKLRRIYGEVLHPNIASAKRLEKSGLQLEGRLRKADCRHGKWLDFLVYSILKEEFKVKNYLKPTL